jgi:hypothetical protein
MANFGAIFLGMTPIPFRPILKEIFTLAKSRYKKLIVPCVGNFTIPQIAVESGWQTKDIICSDIALYCQVMADLISGIEDMKEIEVNHTYFDKIVKATGEKTLYELLIFMKVTQFRKEINYEKDFIDEILGKSTDYKKQLKEEIKKIKERLHGITYYPADLRLELTKYADDKDNLIWFNPPAYAKGYEKMWKFEGALSWKSIEVQELDWSKEFNPLFKSLLEGKALSLVYRTKNLEDYMKPYAVVGVQYSKIRYDYILCTRPVEIPGHLKRIIPKKQPELKPIKTAVFSDMDEIKPDSKVFFKITEEGVALYYRSLWAHRLGETKSEMYVIWFIDGKLFSTTAFFLADIFQLKSNMIFESFGFSVPSKKYQNINRLLMLCMCSGEFKEKLLKQNIMQKNKLFEIRGLRTTCLSKYRKVKLNNGILELVSREKMKNNMYKLVYESPFQIGRAHV